MGLKGLRDSYFTSLFAAPYLGLLANFASCVFVVGLVWRIFICSLNFSRLLWSLTRPEETAEIQAILYGD